MRIPPLLFYVAMAVSICYGDEEIHANILDAKILTNLAAEPGNSQDL